uniref:Xylulose kinase n=1 Tax=Cacopsylla melanoneura TaxID=428564 RepID=A0A8D8RRU0_9HEMI
MDTNGVSSDDDFDKSFLGLDFSTQQLKAVIVDEKLRVRHSASVQFDTVLPEFRTHNGVIRGPEKHTVTAPTLMWVKALDILLDQLRVEGADFGKLVALSGTGQQHGTVYWSRGARSSLQNLDPAHFLHAQLASCFSIAQSPVWMDASTTQQCRDLEHAVGGAEKLADITGSVGYERFSGAQISKIAQTKPGPYENTERISLVSSFACSLFLGDYAPIDWSDGSGMNLLDINTKTWCPQLLEACAPELATKLGEPVPCNTDLGSVHEYYVERFGFNPECRVVVFTGDNPSSMAGMLLKEGDVAISLGTSDTLFLPSPSKVSLPQGHVLINPVLDDGYMVLLCFKNGSLTRERIRDSCAEGTWETFNRYLDSTPRGNFGNMGIYYDAQEILPWAPPGDYRYDKAHSPVTKFSAPESDIRALVEGQFLAKRVFAERLGFRMCASTRILATGGGASNACLLQVLADIFNAPVYTLDGVDSANLGGAYRAKHCYDCLQSKQNQTNGLSTKPETNKLNLVNPLNKEDIGVTNSPNPHATITDKGTSTELSKQSQTPRLSPTKQLANQSKELPKTNPFSEDVTHENDVPESKESLQSNPFLEDTAPSSENRTESSQKDTHSSDENPSTQENTVNSQDKSKTKDIDETVESSQLKDSNNEKVNELAEPDFFQSTSCAPPAKLLCIPYPDASKIYDPMVERYKSMISKFEATPTTDTIQ